MQQLGHPEMSSLTVSGEGHMESLSYHSSRIRRSVRRRRKIFTGDEEAVVAHARAVMDLVSDLARSNRIAEGGASGSSESLAANDYILQIQVRVGQTDCHILLCYDHIISFAS